MRASTFVYQHRDIIVATFSVSSQPHASVVRDVLDRPLRDLRLSVIDRCNLRCRYCMPRDVFDVDHSYLAREEILSFEELNHLVTSMIPLGIEKIRLTGGEPLLRRDFPKLVEILSTHGVELAVTTNGILLEKQAEALAAAGLDRVTVSLDALDDETFQLMTDTDAKVSDVLAGIDAAVAAGISPVKINTVVRKGVNEHAVLQLFNHFQGSGVIVRFIEYMDVGASNKWRRDDVVTGSEILEMLGAEHDLQPVVPENASQVAKLWQTSDGDRVGLITSISEPFCGDCTRGRISAEGRFYTCLFSDSGFDIKPELRSGAGIDELQELVRSVWLGRTDRYSELRDEGNHIHLPVEMSHIGG
ncbi:MAG: GTP 3',8-cyclase MoaA [Candidatus Thalassarchaeaceae archaeon]|nr:GTP 3',8-cyclase MoaA [Candidatus Thalassarchaeaceae archaeon]